MENSKTINNEELAKCPYHAQLSQSPDNDDPREEANTGDWDDEREETDTDPDYYDEGGNNNSGGAGSSGSAATNS